MTNEELAVLIQQGERDKLIILWDQVKRLVMQRAHRMYRFTQYRGVTMDDLMQAGFLAVMSAVRYYNGQCAFSTVLVNCLKGEFANATGYMTKKAREDPFWNAAPLDAPMNDEDPEGATLSDFIIDTEAEQAFPDSEQGVLREALAAELARLTEEQQTVIRLQYWYDLELDYIARIMGKSFKEVKKIKNEAMSRLRRNWKALKPFFAREGDYLLAKECREYRAKSCNGDALSAALALLTAEQRMAIVSAYRVPR